MARTPVASDTFDSAISGSWANGDGDWATCSWAAGGFVQPTAANTDCSIRWTADTPGNDQYCSFVIGSFGSSNAILGAMCRAAAGTDESTYIGSVNIAVDNKYSIYEVNASFGFSLLSGAGTAGDVADGSTVTLEAEGTALRLYTDEGGGDTLRVSTTDATLASGSWAMYLYDQTVVAECRITSWVGGNITAAGGDPEGGLIGGKLLRGGLLMRGGVLIGR